MDHALRCSPHPSRGQQQMRRRCHSFQMDAARAPHGDNNILVTALFTMSGVMQPVPLTGTATGKPLHSRDNDRRCSPHPSRGQQLYQLAEQLNQSRCSPCPSRGQQPSRSALFLHAIVDAARTPHGDSNPSVVLPHAYALLMQPAPLTGTKKRETRNSSVSCLPFYISACSLTSLFHIDEEGYAGIRCHSPCAAGFRCVLRGRRQLVYILSLYLSYVK